MISRAYRVFFNGEDRGTVDVPGDLVGDDLERELVAQAVRLSSRRPVDEGVIEACNPGIRRTVRWLNDVGYDTCDSGDGETDEHSCDRDEGYVVVRLRSDQEMVAAADDIHARLREFGAPVGFDGESGILVTASYCPDDGLRLVDIHGITDRLVFGEQGNR